MQSTRSSVVRPFARSLSTALRPAPGALAVLAALLAGACGGSSGGGGQSGIPGQELPKGPNPGDGSFFVDRNQGGGAARFHIAEVTWGRLVDVLDVDLDVVFRDFVIEDQIQSNADYTLERNPITQKERLIIDAQWDLTTTDDEFDRLVKEASDDLPIVTVKADDGTAAPPFSMVPRNACMVVRFDDCLGDSAAAEAQLFKTVKVLTGYPPSTPYDARIVFDDNHGALIGGAFHSTRVLIDLTVSEIENATLPANALGLPASLVSTSQTNFSVRIPTRIDQGSGQVTVLVGLSGQPLSDTENGPIDTLLPTRDVVRAARSGNPNEANNGFLLDRQEPRVVGGWPLDVSGAIPDPAVDADPLRDFVLDVAFASVCETTPVVGDFIRRGEVFLEVTEVGPSLKVTASEDVASAASLNGAGLYLLPFDETLGVDDACWVSFIPPPESFPSTGVATLAQVVLHFSEPMDPASLSPLHDFLVVRGVAGATSTAQPASIVVGQVNPSDDLIDFAFTPTLPFDHTLNLPDSYHVELGDARDLAGNDLEDDLPFADFLIHLIEPTTENGGLVLRFGSTDEFNSTGAPGGDGRKDLRGQFFYDLPRGIVKPRPVAFTGWPADRTNLVPGAMVTLTGGVLTPLNPLGARLQAVWRYCDLGWDVVDETKYNVDVMGLNWSPIGSQVIRDTFESFEIRLGHSRFLPDEGPDGAGGPRPASGLQTAPNTFDGNLLNDPLSTMEVVHNRALGYFVNSADLFLAPTGTLMMPYPLNRVGAIDKTYTWRDTAILARAAPNGFGIPTDIERAVGAPIGGGVGSVAVPGQVPSFGLPLLIEIRCFPSDDAVGLNSFDVSVTSTASTTPFFRVYSAGTTTGGGQPQPKNPDLELIPANADNVFYIGQLDVVTRVSRIHSVWLDTGVVTPDFVDPAIEPTFDEQPGGTSAQLHFRGATGFSGDASTNPFDGTKIDPYGDLATADGTVTFLNGIRTWASSIHAIDGARFVQVRITFLNNIQTGLNAELSALGLAFEE
ncbi:MAG: Ig-like domain-containing protein [Actinobacteria bacterium]|nr:Ig-like domain-containing protein [Actinomycetota bacterium]